MKVGVALGERICQRFCTYRYIGIFAGKRSTRRCCCRTSIGAIVGASYACGNLDRLKAQALNINRLNWTAFFNPSFFFRRLD